LSPDLAEAWAGLGLARLSQGNHAGAEEAYQRAFKLSPDLAEAWAGLGLARLGQGNHAGAEEAFRRAITIEKKWAEGWINVGVACYHQGHFKETYKALLEATGINPQYIAAYAAMVELHVMSKGRLDALKRLDRSLKLKKIEVHVRTALHLLRACALTAEENKPAALQALKNGQKWIEKLDPNARTEQRQAVLTQLMDSLQNLILPETWKVVDNFLRLMAQAAPLIHEVIGRLETVVRYFEELEFESGEKNVRRDKAASRVQRILDRLPSEERGPIEEIVKQVAENIKFWEGIKKSKSRRLWD